ncbi:extracellular solute-binding protein [Paenibacillus doosanensis]|uniref:extracellular solute-binding protein n=1 Tax=Paenibacillus doosanensis TaxID=1229154 RepID=UPI00217FBADD|nr:extracellular solute-binding protein [Paenibacillus doosanensis]MCS7463361.1 extracellular solute-binding protein [Paenibacillus doosanensis]
MPTIKDIAKAAGVSHGTVSNVLNGRGNVSLEKIKLVEEAAKKMGYQIHAQAKSLREGSTTTVSVILPNIALEQYNKLYLAVYHCFRQAGYHTSLYLTQDQQEIELSILQSIAANRDCAVIAVSCLPDARSYYDALGADADNIFFVYRRLDHSNQFASFDFAQAGQAIARKIAEKNHPSIGLFTDSAEYSCTVQFKDALLHGVAHLNPRFRHVASSHSTAYSHAFDFFSEERFDCIVTTDMERARYIKNAHYLGNTGSCPAIYSLADSEFLAEDGIVKYHLNYQLLGKEIAEHIVQRTAAGQDLPPVSPIMVQDRGFLFEDAAHSPSPSDTTLNILTIPSPTTEALRKLLPHFKKTTGIEFRLAVYSFEEIYDILLDIDNHRHYDIIRVDLAGLSWVARQALKPLPPELTELLAYYPRQLADRYSYVDDTPYAVPFDPSVQLLFYRKDLFEDTKIRRMFYERYKLELNPPNTFHEFNLISEFFSSIRTQQAPHFFGSAVTTGNAEIIASEFLLRYYAEGGSLIQADHKLALSGEMAVKALQSYMDHLSIAKELHAKWWDESISLFERGDLAMLIVYMNLFSHVAHSPIAPLIGFSQVPGHSPLLGGGSLGVSRHSQKDREAAAFFKWFYHNEIAEQIALLGGSSVHNVIYGNQNIMEQYPWLKFAKDLDDQGIRESSFGPGHNLNLRKVEKIIGLGVRNVINRMMGHEEAIEYINSRLAGEMFE